MKSKVHNQKQIIFILLCLILISCQNSIFKTEYSIKLKKYKSIHYQAASLINESKLKEAKELIFSAINNDTPRFSPFVQDETLIYYAQNSSQSFYYMFYGAIYFYSVHNDDSAKKNLGDNAYLLDVYKETPWTQSITIFPDYPYLYYYLGYIYNSENNPNLAINYLDTALKMDKGFAEAWSEMIYSYISLDNFTEAKYLGNRAINLWEVVHEQSGYSAILRKLAYIALKENDLCLAEHYYQMSYSADSNYVAKNELEYIREHKNN